MTARTLLLGLGSVATHAHGGGHLKQYLSDPRIEVVAGVDPDPVARVRALSFGLKTAFARFEDALSALDFDYVSILTPTDNHAQACRRVAASGKHILCEKPISATLQEALEVREFIRDSGVGFFVSMNQRFLPLARRLRDDCKSEYFGELILIDFDECMGFDWNNFGYRKPLIDTCTLRPFWGDPGDHGLQRLLVLDKLVHFIDLLTFWTGSRVRSVYAHGGGQGRFLTPGENFAALQLRLESGTCCRLFDFWGSHHDDRAAGALGARLRIFGSKASAVCESTVRGKTAVYRVFHENREIFSHSFPTEVRTDYADSLLNLTRIVHERPHDYSELDQAVDIMRVVEAVYQSMRSNEVSLVDYSMAQES